MNIAMVSARESPLTATDRGGAGEQSTCVAELAAALARRGHRVTVYTRRDDADLPERSETPQGYHVVHVPAGAPKHLTDDELLREMGPFARFIGAAWTANSPDVIHAHCWMSGIATELVARELELPRVLSFHGLGADGLRRKMESKLANAATGVSVGSTDEAFELIRLGTRRTNTAVIPCGVDVDVYAPDGPQAPRSEAPRVVGIGKLLPGKGFDTMIRPLPLIPNAEFVVIAEADSGDPSCAAEAARLRGLSEELGVADRLRLWEAARVADMPALLRSADVVVCTPSSESSGIVALKTMACGVPVIGSAVGALRDILVHDVTGYLVARPDPRKLATAVNSLMRDSFLRHSMGSAGRDRVVARYTWDRVAADTVRLYERSMSMTRSEPRAASG